MNENNSYHLASTITTTLAALFNLLVLFVICFAVMPQINQARQETIDNRKLIEENHDMLTKNRTMLQHTTVDLERHNEVMKLLNELIDTKKKGK